MKTYEWIPRYTYDDYKIWEGKWELIYGYPHSMSPSPFKPHQKLSGKLHRRFDELLEVKITCVCDVIQDLDWIISDDTVVRPDLMIVYGEFKKHLHFPPSLAIEIISPSTSMKDYNIKYRLYESQKVKYYIIVNPENKECNLFELQDSVYVQNDKLKDFSFHADCKIVFDIPAFVRDLNLD